MDEVEEIEQKWGKNRGKIKTKSDAGLASSVSQVSGNK